MGEIRKIEAVERGMMRDKEIFFFAEGKVENGAGECTYFWVLSWHC